MDVVIRNIYNDIQELSDLGLQRKLWLNQNNDTGLISSYIELMCRLFDDDEFDFFIDTMAPNYGLSNDLIKDLDRLRNMLRKYDEKETDEEIIIDPDWRIIVDQAKCVILKWNIV